MRKTSNSKIFSNYLLVIISTTVVIFFLSSFLVIILNSEKIINDLKERIPVVVFLKENITTIEFAQFEKKLKINERIKSFDFITNDIAAENLSKDIGEDFLEFLGYNPLLDSFDIFFYSEYINSFNVDKIVEQLKNEDFISEVTYDAPLIFLINSNFEKLKKITIILGCLFMLISLILINNTIRLSLYSNRLNIKTMQLVGAKKSFIMWPIIKNQIFFVLAASIISSLIILLILYYFSNNIFEINIYQIQSSLIISFSASLLFSLLISFISTTLITNRFLNSKIDKLY
ncbi:MAG: cell division protein FtsX [Flavobacteriaceae bacterium]